ncbi:unnamed protein product, partial [Rotaria sp. Silwood1]
MFRSHRKLALAIGISDYERNIRLPNTINDARDMSSKTYYLRSEPLIKATARSLNSNTSNPIGLKEMIVKAGMLIAYACAPGTIANDVPNERNGLFTKHLLEHIGTPNKDIRMVVANVTNGVKAESRWKQIPHLTTNLSAENVYLFELSP